MSKLKSLREQRGVMQQAVAEHLGVSRQTYCRYEKDPDSMSIAQARAVCGFLHCGMGDIFLTEEVK